MIGKRRKYKVNLYLWHRMKRKLILSIISIVACLSIMSIGVIASNSNTFKTAVSNDISVKIAAVDGVLSAKRSGGIYTNSEDIEEDKRGKITEDLNDFETFQVLYTKEDNTTSYLEQIEKERLDINVYNNKLEYIFKYQIEPGAAFETYIYIGELNKTWYNGEYPAEQIKEVSYRYMYCVDPALLNSNWEVGAIWDEENPQNQVTEFIIDSSKGATNYITIGGAGSSDSCVYIRCYIEYNTEKMGNLSYNKDKAENYGPTSSGKNPNALDMSLTGVWHFKLNLLSAKPSIVGGTEEHEHVFNNWLYNDEYHWQPCQYPGCRAVSGEPGTHAYPGAWTVKTEASENQPEIKSKSCIVCGKELISDEVRYATSTDSFVIDSSGVITGYTGTDKNVIIPAYVTVNGKKVAVTKIDTEAFKGTSIESVTIPSTVTAIEADAFRTCVNLTQIDLTNAKNLTTIGDGAFYGCKNLTDADLSGAEDLEFLGEYAFASCSKLISITIPTNVKSIMTNAFSGCTGLAIVYNLSKLNITAGDLTNGGVSQYAYVVNPPETVRMVDDEETKIRYYIDGDTKVALGLLDFTVTDLKFAEDTDIIRRYAFYGNTVIESVAIPSSVREIQNDAFTNCKNIKIVTNESSLDIVKGATTHGGVAYYAIIVGETNEEWEEFTLDGIQYMETVSRSTQIAMKVVERKPVLIFDANTTEIQGNLIYSDTTIKEIVFNEGLKSIGPKAFAFMNSLREITLPSTIESLGSQAFYYCDMLVWVKNYSSLQLTPGANTFGNVAADALSVSPNDGEWYLDPYNVRYFIANGKKICYSFSEADIPTKEYTIEEGTFALGKKSMNGVSGIVKKLIIPSTLIELRNNCILGVEEIDFSKATSLTTLGAEVMNGFVGETLVLPATLTTLTSYSLSSKTMKVLDMSACTKITLIPPSGCAGATNLKQVIFPSTIYQLSYGAFMNCASMEEITFPSSFKNLSQNVFVGCSMLKKVTFEEGSQFNTIYENTFNGCTALASINLEDTLCSYLGNGVFYNCTGLTEIALPATLTSVNASAFSGCTNLKSVIVLGQTVSNNYTERTAVGNVFTNAENVYFAQGVTPSSYVLSNYQQITSTALEGYKEGYAWYKKTNADA